MDEGERKNEGPSRLSRHPKSVFLSSPISPLPGMYTSDSTRSKAAPSVRNWLSAAWPLEQVVTVMNLELITQG